MKHAAAFLAVIFLISFSPVLAADAQYGNAGELYQSWYENSDGTRPFPYPDGVNGAWSTDGGGENITFGLVEGTPDTVKEDILDLVTDKESVTFEENGKHTIDELVQVQSSIEKLMGDESGIYGCGVDEINNCVTCDVDKSNKNAESSVESISSRYGDMVAFENNGMPVVTESMGHAPKAWIIIAAVSAVILAAAIAAAVLISRSKRRKDEK